MPKFTCITTVFNDGPILRTGIDSILGQTHEDFELIVVDDGSDAETRAILESYDDERITLIRQANDGLSGARNKALEQVSGDYVCFLDADDSRPNWALATINEVIERDSPDLILTRGTLAEIRGEPRAFYDQPIFEQIADFCPSGHIHRNNSIAETIWPLAQQIEPQSANKIVRAEVIQKLGSAFPNTHFFEDMFFHTNVLAAANSMSFVQTPCFSYFRRYQKQQITGGTDSRRFDAIAVAKLTLESFSRSRRFHDPAYRASVLFSCLKIVKWCGESISNIHKPAFQKAACAMLRMVDPLYQHTGPELTDTLGANHHVKDYYEALLNAG